MGRIGFVFLIGHCCIHALSSLPHPSWAVLLVVALIVARVLRAPVLAALVLGIAWAWGSAAARRLRGEFWTGLSRIFMLA